MNMTECPVMYGYFNGEIKPVSDMALGMTDLSILRGYGLFDYMRTYNGQIFQWDWYWERLSHSAKIMGLVFPLGKDDTRKVMMSLLAKSQMKDASIRTILTGGYSPDSMQVAEPNVAIMIEALPVVPAVQYEQGIHVILDEYVRAIPDVKTTDYKHVIMLASRLQQLNAQDVLYHKNGVISELSRSNVFIVKDKVLITRRCVLHLAEGQFRTEERAVTVEELQNADEVFTTSSNKKILPITKINGQNVAEGHVGLVTKQLLTLFQDFVQHQTL
jgi:branched-chain amino acid aminotransferase